MFAIGAVLIRPVALPSLLRERWQAIPRSAWIGLVLVIAGPTVGAYVINAWTLKYAESSLVAAYSYLQPVLTTIMAGAFLHEKIRPIVAVAGFAGALADSFFGATLQALRYCSRCQRLCETDPHTCESATSLVRGWGAIDNDAVNAIATVTGALAAGWVASLYTAAF